MLCPLCNKQAISPHHIKSRAEGGTDDFRNIVWLCKRCHDEIEGQTITPRLIELKRLEKLGRAQTAQEVYNYRYAEGGVMFMGITRDEEWLKDIPSFLITYDSQFIMPITKTPKIEPSKSRRKKGRPKLAISPELLLQNSSLSLRKRAAKSGISFSTFLRKIRLNQKSSIENDIPANKTLDFQGENAPTP